MTNAIKLNDRTTVYLTKKAHSVRNGIRKEGEAVSIHPKQAESWVASGIATKTSKNSKKED